MSSINSVESLSALGYQNIVECSTDSGCAEGQKCIDVHISGSMRENEIDIGAHVCASDTQALC